MKKKLKRLLLSERGDSSYISSFVYILVAVVLIAFIINVFHIISTKQEMDHMADQLVKHGKRKLLCIPKFQIFCYIEFSQRQSLHIRV